MTRTHRSKADIEATLASYLGELELSDAGESAQFEEMVIKGCLACPKAKTLRQRKDYFSNMTFSTLEDLLGSAEFVNFV